jgi:hypothetical protein
VAILNKIDLLYSDRCFLEFITTIKNRLKSWEYIQDIQMVVLKHKTENVNHNLDFSNYYSLNIRNGLEKKYISSFQQFIGAFIESIIYQVKIRGDFVRISKLDVLKKALAFNGKTKKDVSLILKDRSFYIPSNVKK